MELSILEDSAWYSALTLRERLATFSTADLTCPADAVDLDLGKRRLQHWRSQPPFDAESHFQQRLEMDGIGENNFLCLLGRSMESVRDRLPGPPTWLLEMNQAFAYDQVCDGEMMSRLKNLTWDERSKQLLGFLNLAEPLLHWGRNRVHEGIQAMNHLLSGVISDLQALEDILVMNLATQLLPMLSRTLILELNVARLRGILQGETPFERFQSFTACLCQREFALTILKEYPVLARQLKICTDDWIAFSLEFLEHLSCDWGAVLSLFSPGKKPGTLVGLRANMGDQHRGRSVVIAQFDSGLVILYKPRCLAIDLHFQELLAWLNDRTGDQLFRTIKVLDRETHGWVEYVSPKGCTSIEEIQRFYKRQGAYIALLHLMQATDFHFENLIAAGEYPILIDLETLWHQDSKELLALDKTLSEHVAAAAVSESVLRVGLLPQQLWVKGDFGGVDLSGLGADTGQLLTPTKIVQYEGVGSDQMRVIRERIKFAGRDNRPNLNGKETHALDYIQTIVDGFEKMYRIFIQYRDELLSDSGPLARFAQDETRFIIRPSHTYGLLLAESFHPDLLRDALDRERHFDRLWVGIEDYPYYEKVISAERDDLWRGNLPIFFTRPDSCDLWCSSGQRITGFFKESCLERARCRLLKLGEKDLERQTWFILASFASIASETTNGDTRNSKHLYSSINTSLSPEPTRREQLLDAAHAIGDRLETLALRGKNDACWVGLSSFGSSLRPMPLGADFYSGLTGISLFLAYLGRMVDEDRYTALAHAALCTARRQFNERLTSFTPIGAFSGWGGMIYSLVHLSVLWQERDLLDEALRIVNILPGLIRQDQDNDIMSGTAGCLASLSALYQIEPSQHVGDVILACGNRLIACAQHMEKGVGWNSSLPAFAPLTGFSHGAAGIAWALLETSHLVGEERFRSIALDAIAYERSMYSSEDRNWPDLRKVAAVNNDGKRFMAAWCHGAPGVGMARLLSLQYLDSEETRSEIEAALQTTISAGFGRGHCLCHGGLGNIDVLLTGGRILPDSPWQSHAYRLAGQVLASIEKQGWICGVPLGTETPGLMTGLAGIGFEFLRLADPDRVPSILAISPPNLSAWNGGQR